MILLSLVSGKKHGYAIQKYMEAESEGRLSLSTSTLYTALGRLLDQGLIERVPSDEEGPEKGRPGLPRKAYILTDEGRNAIRAETQRLTRLMFIAHSEQPAQD